MKTTHKGIVIALMLSSISVQALNAAVFAKGGQSGGWSMNRAAFMRQDSNRFDSHRFDNAQRGRPMEPPRAFDRAGFGGERGDMNSAGRKMDSGAERAAHVQDFNWGKSSDNGVKPWGAQTKDNSNLLAKAPAATAPTAKVPNASSPTLKPPFNKEHPRRSEVSSRDKFLDNKIQGDKGDLNGHYPQLARKDNAIKRQEQIDARLHNGHITPAEQRRLNREENRLTHQIRRDDHGKFSKAHSLPNQPWTKSNVPGSANSHGGTPASSSTTPGGAATNSSNTGFNGKPTSSLSPTVNSPLLSGFPVTSTSVTGSTQGIPGSTQGIPGSTQRVTGNTQGVTGSTPNATGSTFSMPAAAGAGGLASMLPMMSSPMFNGDSDSQDTGEDNGEQIPSDGDSTDNAAR